MQETLHDHHTPISIGPYATYDLLTTDIYLMGNSSGELQDLTNRLVERATVCGMEFSTGKSKIITNSTNNISAYISMKGQKLEEVFSFKYPVKGWHMLSRSPRQDCLSNGSNDQSKQDLAVQHH